MVVETQSLEKCIFKYKQVKLQFLVKCFKRQKWGHHYNNCPETANLEQHFQPDKDEDDNSEHELPNDERNDPKVSFQNSMVVIISDSDETNATQNSSSTILLDTSSNISVFNNNKLLTNIGARLFTHLVFTNGGHQDSIYVGHLVQP